MAKKAEAIVLENKKDCVVCVGDVILVPFKPQEVDAAVAGHPYITEQIEKGEIEQSVLAKDLPEA